jgi:hypothetical protein
MNYTPAEYINAGFSFEKGKTPAQTLRHMIESEHLDFKIEARRLIEQGRTEARLSETQNR